MDIVIHATKFPSVTTGAWAVPGEAKKRRTPGQDGVRLLHYLPGSWVLWVHPKMLTCSKSQPWIPPPHQATPASPAHAVVFLCPVCSAQKLTTSLLCSQGRYSLQETQFS